LNFDMKHIGERTMIRLDTRRMAPPLLSLLLATLFLAGFWLPIVTAPAEASAHGQVIVIGARVVPALM
jgi:hypothetical protein